MNCEVSEFLILCRQQDFFYEGETPAGTSSCNKLKAGTSSVSGLVDGALGADGGALGGDGGDSGDGDRWCWEVG